MAEQVKIGVIGTSWWADNILLALFASSERAKIAAICGRNRERADEVAAKYSIPQVFTDYRQMIEHGKLDAIVVSTPDDTHYDMVMAALDAGLHVFCEKPVSLNALHAKAMYEKAEGAGVRHMVMYTWHWEPPMQRFKQLADEGYIGKIYQGNFVWQSPFGRSKAYQWRVDSDHSNGILGDLGSHMLQLALWTMGDVATVSAQLGFHIDHDDTDGKPLKRKANDSARVMLEFASGAQAHVEVSAVAHLLEQMKISCVLHGEKGTLEAGWIFGDQFTFYVRGGLEGSEEKISEEIVIDLVDYFKTHPIGPRQFVDAILDDKPIYPGLYEGYKVQQVIDAALESHQTGCRVILAP